jgi:hypothetical protein
MEKADTVGMMFTTCQFGSAALFFSEIKTYYSEEKKTQESQTQPNTKTVIDSDGKVKSPEHLKHVKKPIKYN